MKDNYEPVIGLEIHCELKTKSNMFCSCANNPFGSEPNANICPICLGFPGTLPVPNKRAIEMTLMVGKALSCQPAKESKFDRKNYFYPDLPKGYQISQYDLPLMQNGHFTPPGGKKIRIRRIHLEEDTGKLLHQEGKDTSLVDYNRAGVPLIELVTEPDITSPDQASGFAKELQLLLRYLGASNADMEKGEMRVEANVSVRMTDDRGQKTDKLGTKVEIKNLNSFRSVQQAIGYELDRQVEMLQKGKIIVQETRGWDEDRGVTFSQRTKEEAEDYRYFPEPDIPPLDVSKWQIGVTESPEERRRRYVEKLGIDQRYADVLVSDKEKADFFEAVLQQGAQDPKTAASWIVNQGIDPVLGRGLPDFPGEIANMLSDLKKGEITPIQAVEHIRESTRAGRWVIWRVLKESFDLDTTIDQVLSQNPSAVADIKAGKMQALGFLVGQVMAKTHGRADPKVVNELLQKKLEE